MNAASKLTNGTGWSPMIDPGNTSGSSDADDPERYANFHGALLLV
jgi:hypothetical protein